MPSTSKPSSAMHAACDAPRCPVPTTVTRGDMQLPADQVIICGRIRKPDKPHMPIFSTNTEDSSVFRTSPHMWISVIDRRDEQLLDGPGIDPADQIEDGARLVVGAAGPRAAEGLLADDLAGRLVVDVEVAGGEAERLGRRRDRRP